MFERRKIELVLLGAGASKDADVPTANEMTDTLLDRAGEFDPEERHALRFAVGTLVFGRALRNEHPLGGLNIEEVYNVLETLAERNRLEAAPLISSWHPLIEQLDTVRVPGQWRRQTVARQLTDPHLGHRMAELAQALCRARPGNEHEIERRLNEAFGGSFHPRGLHFEQGPPRLPEFQAPEDIPGNGEIFRSVMDRLVSQLKSLTWLTDANKVRYLDPLVTFCSQNKASVVTLNYDNAVELSAAGVDIKVDSGIGHWLEKGEFGEPADDALHLVKLHGSIDWSIETRSGNAERPLDHEVISPVEGDQVLAEEHKPALVFGGRNKLTAKGPFLELLRVFRSRLTKANTLAIVGYSFGDDHINECLRQWMNGNPTRQLQICNGEGFGENAEGFVAELLGLGDRVINLRQRARQGIGTIFDL